jgi:hypothetical protein
VLSSHDRGHEWSRNIGQALVGADDGGGRIAFVVGGRCEVFGRIWIVVLIRVGGQGAESDGDARSLEVGRVEGDDSDYIVVVGL